MLNKGDIVMNWIRNTTFFVIAAFLASFFTAGSALADSQEREKEFTLFYTGDTLGYLDPCIA
jgi:hypothetical protein